MSEDLQEYLWGQLDHHLDKLDDALQSESSFEVQEYHLNEARDIKNKLQGALKRG